MDDPLDSAKIDMHKVGKNKDTASFEYMLDWKLEEKFKHADEFGSALTPKIEVDLDDERFSGKTDEEIAEIVAGMLSDTMSYFIKGNPDMECAMAKSYCVKDGDPSSRKLNVFGWVALRRPTTAAVDPVKEP